MHLGALINFARGGDVSDTPYGTIQDHTETEIIVNVSLMITYIIRCITIAIKPTIIIIKFQ